MDRLMTLTRSEVYDVEEDGNIGGRSLRIGKKNKRFTAHIDRAREENRRFRKEGRRHDKVCSRLGKRQAIDEALAV